MPHDTAEEPSPASLGRALASLHEVLRGFDGDLPWLGPAREDARGVLDRLWERGGLAGATREQAYSVRCDETRRRNVPSGLHASASAFAASAYYPNPTFGLDDALQKLWQPVANAIEARTAKRSCSGVG